MKAVGGFLLLSLFIFASGAPFGGPSENLREYNARAEANAAFTGDFSELEGQDFPNNFGKDKKVQADLNADAASRGLVSSLDKSHSIGLSIQRYREKRKQVHSNKNKPEDGASSESDGAASVDGSEVSSNRKKELEISHAIKAESKVSAGDLAVNVKKNRDKLVSINAAFGISSSVSKNDRRESSTSFKIDRDRRLSKVTNLVKDISLVKTGSSDGKEGSDQSKIGSVLTKIKEFKLNKNMNVAHEIKREEAVEDSAGKPHVAIGETKNASVKITSELSKDVAKTVYQ